MLSWIAKHVFPKHEGGQTTAEYAVALSIITAAIVAAIGSLSDGVRRQIADVAAIFVS
jgi:Flp pilus assembly pilin Flp